MHIESVTISNFRCFGPVPTIISLTDLTCVIGANGTGKSAVLQALAKMFGLSNPERELVRSDFCVPAGADEGRLGEVSLFIEARLAFPELIDDTDDDAVCECYRQMIVEAPGATPFCRVRLEGQWIRAGTPDGVVEQSLYWITSPLEEPPENSKKLMKAYERSRISVVYLPAARDPSKQMKFGSASLLARALRAVNWSDDVEEVVKAASDAVFDQFSEELGIQSIQNAIVANWKDLHDEAIHATAEIRPLGRELNQVLRNVEIILRPSPSGTEDRIDRLSDGLQSLFYLALVGMSFDIEEAVLEKTEFDKNEHGLVLDQLDPPSLVMFAMEEPENHLSPHFLGRIVQRLRKLALAARGQVIITSHSPSIVSRVEPEEVRYLRLDGDWLAHVRHIELPPKQDEAHKFIREAVQTFPELYFARLVVLGEGDSESIVIPRLAVASGLPLDRNFVSVVPLGGRHVNHLWRLLSSLKIPFITLLDLDRERTGGGWGRIKYVYTQLLENGVDSDKLLTTSKGILRRKELARMHTWDVSQVSTMKGWITRLELYNVFFAAPLDIGFAMLSHFPAAYASTLDGDQKPLVPTSESDNYDEELRTATYSVLKSSSATGATFTEEEKALFFSYRALFLNRSKPTTHISALLSLTGAELKRQMPPVLARLVQRIGTLSGLSK